MIRLATTALLVTLLSAGLVCLQSRNVTASTTAESVILAHVDGEPVTLADLDAILDELGTPRLDSSPISAEDALRRLIQNRLLEQEGFRIGAQETPEVSNQVKDLVQYQSMTALLDSVSAEVPLPDESEFDDVLDVTSTMIRISHILVDDEAQIRSLHDRLSGGATFAELADHHSVDTTFAGPGGDLGWMRSDVLIPEFANAVDGLAPGAFSEPVATEKGWHILTLTDTRTETVGQSGAMKQAVMDAEKTKLVMEAMQIYVASLKQKHDVKVNDTLLKSLDYASADPKVQEKLKNSPAVLASLPRGDLTVGGLSFKIRYKYFHGTEGKEDADEIRDRQFDEWLTESLLRYEAMALGFHKQPRIVAARDQLERQLVRETVLETLLRNPPLDPTPDEIQAYYVAHPDMFRSGSEVRVQGVLLESWETAWSFQKKLKEGADVDWLAERQPGVVDPSPPSLAGWLKPEVVGLTDEPVPDGSILEPFQMEETWAVATVETFRPPGIKPLERCRELVARGIKGERRRGAVTEALAQLESMVEIQVAAEAHELIGRRIDEWRGVSLSTDKP